MSLYYDDPITVALDGDGVLRHVDEVPKGLACNCRCPAPGCGAPLVAKNGGTKVIHHFAHQSGSNCEWAMASALARLAESAIKRLGKFCLPAYYVSYGYSLQSRVLHAEGVEEVFLEGWGAPMLRVSCWENGEAADYLFLIAWNEVPWETWDAIVATGLDTVAICLKDAYRAWKHNQERHADRKRFMQIIQSEEVVDKLVAGACSGRNWLSNPLMDAAKEDYWRMEEPDWRERHREAVLRMDSERLARELFQEREKAREEAARAEKARLKEARLTAMRDFCECNGLMLLRAKGAGRLVDCPMEGAPIGASRTDRGCCVCEECVRDFGTHIACAADDWSGLFF